MTDDDRRRMAARAHSLRRASREVAFVTDTLLRGDGSDSLNLRVQILGELDRDDVVLAPILLDLPRDAVRTSTSHRDTPGALRSHNRAHCPEGFSCSVLRVSIIASKAAAITTPGVRTGASIFC